MPTTVINGREVMLQMRSKTGLLLAEAKESMFASSCASPVLHANNQTLLLSKQERMSFFAPGT